MTQEELDRHLEAATVAAYVDAALPVAERAAIDAHLALCEECRAEILDVSRILDGARNRRRTLRGNRRLWLSVGAAAALALIWLVPDLVRQPDRVYREETVTRTPAPLPRAPIGPVDSVPALIWSRVPRTTDYRVRLYDSAGTVVWETQTGDTVAPLPPSLVVAPGRAYYWRVEARSGFDRSASSELTGFSTRASR